MTVKEAARGSQSNQIHDVFLLVGLALEVETA
jgi:hypothetical protein